MFSRPFPQLPTAEGSDSFKPLSYFVLEYNVFFCVQMLPSTFLVEAGSCNKQ